jgi:hypothetical protein
MPSWFATKFEDVAMPMLETWQGVSVVLTAGSYDTASFTALATDREYMAIELETGLAIKVASRDWLLPASSIVVNSVTTVPLAGMRITEGSDVYEIVPIAGRPAVEKQEYRYLVHSQRITS